MQPLLIIRSIRLLFPPRTNLTSTLMTTIQAKKPGPQAGLTEFSSSASQVWLGIVCITRVLCLSKARTIDQSMRSSRR